MGVDIKQNTTAFRVLLAQNMRRARRRKKMSQAHLAKACNISTSFVSEIENCCKFPSPETLTRIADALVLFPFQLFLTHEQWEIQDHIGLLKNLFTVSREEQQIKIDSMLKVAVQHHDS